MGYFYKTFMVDFTVLQEASVQKIFVYVLDAFLKLLVNCELNRSYYFSLFIFKWKVAKQWIDVWIKLMKKYDNIFDILVTWK